MRILIVSIVVLLVSNFGFGQINFFKHYSNNGYDYGQGITQLEDSSYVITGSSSSFTNGPSQAFLLKVDSVGNYIWSNSYGGPEAESGRRVLYKQGFGFFMAGYTSSFGAGAYDYYLTHIDEAGQLQWEKTFGGEGWEQVHDAALTRDTGVILVGETNSTDNGHKDMYIVRTDKEGDTLWTKTIGGVGDDVAKCIESYQDSLFVIGGAQYIQDSLKTKAVLIFLKEDGTILDTDTIVAGTNGNYIINDITITGDTVQSIGTHHLFDGASHDIVFYTDKLNGNNIVPFGSFVTVKIGDYYGDLITAYNGGASRYCVIGNENHDLAFEPGQDLLIGKYTNLFNYVETTNHIAAEYPDVGGQIITTSDGGAALVGYREGFGPGGSSIFVLKIGPEDVYPIVDGATFVDDLVSAIEYEPIAGLKVYPNPASDYVTIELPEENFDIELINMMGASVKSFHVFGKNKLNTSGLAPGVYMLNISQDGGLKSSYRLMIK